MKHKRLLFICILAGCIALTTQGWAQQNAPTEVQAAPGNKMAAVSFTAPTAEGGSTITGYTITASDGTTATGTASPIVVKNLTNGTAYSFTVTAINSLTHQGTSSASNSVTPSNTGYAAYAGTWNGTAMSAGYDSPWGQTCVWTLGANGSISMNCTDVSGNPSNYSNCHAWLFAHGITITCDSVNIPNTFLCYLNSASTTSTSVGTVMACTQSEEIEGSPSATLTVGVRQGSGYSSSDMSNTYWYAEGLGIQSGGSAYWEQEISSPVHVPSGGNISVTGTKNKGGATEPVNEAGTLSFSDATTGKLEFSTGNASVYWHMDSGKTVAAGFTSYVPDDDVEISVLSKKAGSYSLADLAGYWAFNKLKDNAMWQRTILEINSDGSFVSTELNSDGTTESGYGKFDISSGGVVTCDQASPGQCSNVKMVMDASKTVMTGTAVKTKGSGAYTYSMTILTKASSLWANSVAFTGGWMGGIWLGNFNVNGAPWIYHETLGWLYPVLSGTSTDSVWFYDPQWDGTGGWWWTSSSLYPWVYSSAEGWLYYDAADSTPSARWFFNGAGQASTH